MKAVKIKTIEGCLEDGYVNDILLDNEIDENFIMHLGLLGKLSYGGASTSTIFSVIVRGKYTLMGSCGKKSFRVLLPGEDPKESMEEIKQHIKKFENI